VTPEHHPIDPFIRSQIEAKLDQLESDYQIKILFACESGSRGWGFASPDSDYDVRFIYVQKLPWYLSVSNKRDVIELPISEDLDINGWELRKALTLLKKGNATLLEWFSSPVIYRADMEFWTKMQDTIPQIHQPERSFYHYYHMAQRNYRESLQEPKIKLKKYLYVLRPLLAAQWIAKGRGAAPMPFQELVDALVMDKGVLADIQVLLKLKRANKETGFIDPMPRLHQYIDQQLLHWQDKQLALRTDIEDTLLDTLLFDAVMQA
jgi:hypothetical protein